jgi:adenylate kinase family enzyme
MGLSGAGKTSVADEIALQTNAITFHGGTRLRSIAASDPDGIVAQCLHAGSPVPGGAFAEIVQQEAASIHSDTLILDGFPRTIEHVSGLRAISHTLRPTSEQRAMHALELDVTEGEARRRIAMRYECPACGRIAEPDRPCESCSVLPVRRSAPSPSVHQFETDQLRVIRQIIPNWCDFDIVDGMRTVSEIAQRVITLTGLAKVDVQ